MKFTINNAIFKKYLKELTKGCNNKETDVIVFKINGENSTLRIETFTTDSYFQGIMNLESIDKKEKIKIVIDSDQLKKILTVLPNDDNLLLEFSINKNNECVIKYNKNTLRLLILNSIAPKMTEEITKIGIVDANEFLSTMKTLSQLVSKDNKNSNLAMNCLSIEIKDKEITMFATNQIGIAEKILENKIDTTNDIKLNILIQQTQLPLLFKAVESNETIHLIETPSKFGYISTDNIVYLVSKNKNFPIDYKPIKNKVLSNENTNKITFNKEEIKQIIDSINKLAPNIPVVNLNLSQKNKEAYFLSNNNDILSANIIAGEFETKSIRFEKSTLLSILSIVDNEFELSYPNLEERNGIIIQVKSFKTNNDNKKLDENLFVCICSQTNPQ